ncbi:MAG: ferric reductase-like transmembrane domain-containing protein [Actinomycetota bacterium]|nr:ferric reductase-like transmembrane domain-containing protein [Actinomycetota bacterium]
MQTSTLSWYIARAAGLTAWSLAGAGVIWGLLISTRASAFGRRPRPAWTLDLHRYLGGLAAVFTVVHVVGILADPWLHLSALAALVPFVSSWRPGAVAWGVAAMYLLVAVELTSLARARLPRKVWRAVHFASFPLFLTATVHAFTAGSDTGSLLFVLVATAVILAVTALTGLRIRTSMSPRPVPSPDSGGSLPPARPAVARAETDAPCAEKQAEVLV